MLAAAAWALTVAVVTFTPQAAGGSAASPGSAAASAASSEWTDDHPFTHLFQNLGTDFKNLPTGTNAAIITVGSVGAASTHPVDASLSAWAIRQGPSWYAGIGNTVGNEITQGAGAIGTYAIGELAHNAMLTHIGSDFIRGQIFNGIFTEALKYTVDRTRPTGSPYSFPSGHTSASFTTAAILQDHFGWSVGTVAYAAAGFVGWCRLRSDQHWTSDVAFGAALGVMAGHTVTTGHHPTSNPKPHAVTITPALMPGGAVISVVWEP